MGLPPWRGFGKNWQTRYPCRVTTMNISLPQALKAFIDERVRTGDYGTSSEYLRELIRRDQSRRRLHELILEGLQSPPVATADSKYWAKKRRRISARR